MRFAPGLLIIRELFVDHNLFSWPVVFTYGLNSTQTSPAKEKMAG